MKKQKKGICVYNFVNYCRFVNASAPPCYKLIPCKWIWWETKYNMCTWRGFHHLQHRCFPKFSSSHFTYSWCGEWWPYFSCQIVAFHFCVCDHYCNGHHLYAIVCYVVFEMENKWGKRDTALAMRMPIVQPWLEPNKVLHKNLTKTTSQL